MAPRLLLVDSYDSFAYNVVHALAALGATVDVVTSDADVSPAGLARYQGIVIGPGPGTPSTNAPLMRAVARAIETQRPVLGICLGMQAIVTSYGGTVVAAPRPVHGEAGDIHHRGAGLFAGLPSPIRAARYHSLCAESATLPKALHVRATSDDGVIQGVEAVRGRVFGLQFHPESFLSEEGASLLMNFLMYVRA